MNLEHCIYCGTPPELEGFGFGDFYQVTCKNSDCGAMGPWRANKDDAIREWNDKYITANKGSCQTCKFTKPDDCYAPAYLDMQPDEQRNFWRDPKHPCRLWVQK